MGMRIWDKFSDMDINYNEMGGNGWLWMGLEKNCTIELACWLVDNIMIGIFCWVGNGEMENR